MVFRRLSAWDGQVALHTWLFIFGRALQEVAGDCAKDGDPQSEMPMFKTVKERRDWTFPRNQQTDCRGSFAESEENRFHQVHGCSIAGAPVC
jgi:hypothetical protein